jgi:uracil permease
MQPRPMTVVAVILVSGVGGLSVGTADWALKGIGLAGILGVLANLLLPGRAPDA